MTQFLHNDFSFAIYKKSSFVVWIIIIIIIIIIINEKINVAFSRKTARTRNSHKKTQAAKTSCLTVQTKKK